MKKIIKEVNENLRGLTFKYLKREQSSRCKETSSSHNF